MNFVLEMRKRGLVAQIAHEEELTEHLAKGKCTAYVGFDPTAGSLHVGHLMPVMMLARWQRMGNRVIVLMGGGTGLIGDPSNKTEMRRLMQSQEINDNIVSFRHQVKKILKLDDPEEGIIVNNADWLVPLEYLPFLREIGSQFSVNRMLSAECFKSRLEKGLTFLEFNYMLLQAYDFLHLFRTENCTVQLGGDDQWSNMLAGVDLVRRMTTAKAFCLTSPLLTTSSGIKMGKTEKGAVWLDPEKTSPYEYYQYWRNIADDMVDVCLRQFTFLDIEEVHRLSALKDQEINEAKKVLAFEATKVLHGEEEAEKAQESSKNLFGGNKGQSGAEPVVNVERSKVESGMSIVDLTVSCGIFSSKSEARRMIEQGGLSINDQRVESSDKKIDIKDFDESGSCLVKKGKKYYYRLKI